jgi:hypothetical protein
MHVAIACHSANDKYRVLPPAYGPYGEAAEDHSLFIHLLPFLQQDSLYERLMAGEPVDNAVVPPYLTASDFTARGDNGGVTNFAGNARVFAAETDTKYAKGAHYPIKASSLAWTKPVRPVTHLAINRIMDGTSNTIAFGTVYSRCAPADIQRGWAAGNDTATADSASPAQALFAVYTKRNGATQNTRASATDQTAIWQLRPSQNDCNVSLLQSFCTMGLSVSQFDAAVRIIAPNISVETWIRAVLPNDGTPMASDWVY